MEQKIPTYLHQPLQILWFDTHEVAILVICYLAATTLGGAFWGVLLIGAPLMIRLKRKRPRGWVNHVVYENGFMSLHGYPLPTQNIFFE